MFVEHSHDAGAAVALGGAVRARPRRLAQRLFAMGGASGVVRKRRLTQAKVFGQMESYNPATDSWQSHAPTPAPRHAVGAAEVGDWIYVAGGAVQSAVHEAFTLG